MVRTLQLAFQTIEEFKWDPDPAVSRLQIYTDYPLTNVKLPAISVSVGGGDALLRTMNEEVRAVSQAEVSYNGMTVMGTTGYDFGGGFQPTVNIEVVAQDSVSRSRILDWVTMCLRYYFWDKLRAEGVNIVDMTFGSPSIQPIGNQLRYVDSLSVVVYTEWNHSVQLATADRINGISLTGIFSTIDGATFPS